MKHFKNLTFLLFGLALVSCQNKTTDLTKPAASLTEDPAYLECNHFTSSGLQGQVNIVPGVDELVMVYFNNSPAAISGETGYVQFFAGPNPQDMHEIQVRVLNRFTHAPISGILADGKIDATVFNNNDLNFSKELNLYAIEANVGLQNKVLGIRLWDDGTLESPNLLIPSFDANPNSYIASHPDLEDLHALHPLLSMRGLNLSNQGYKDLVKCN